MARIWTLNFRSYNILLELQTRVPREFEPCWIQEPLILTDALGRIAPVHLELINSWVVLESVLEARFHNIPGQYKIKRREYALQDRSSQLDIQRSASFESCFLPGRKVDMSMVFKQGHSMGAYCPGCRMECRQGAAVASIWSETLYEEVSQPANRHFSEGCGIWFQRIEELIERDIDESMVEPAPALAESKPVPPSQITPPHANLKTPTPRTVSRKRTADNADLEEHMSLFKRVRLLQPKYINSGGTRANSEQTQRMSLRSYVTNERQRVFAWLEDNRSWEKDRETKRQQILPTYLLKTKSFLQLAAYNGDIEAVREFLSQGEDANAISDVPSDKEHRRYRCTALTAAVERNHVSLVEYLLAAGSDPNVNIEHGDTPLVLAVQNHSLEIAGILLRYGANGEQISSYQELDALQRACYEGNLDMVYLLLSYGANANGPTGRFVRFGPPLVAAAANDNVRLIERLLACGADVDGFQSYTDPADSRRRQNALVRAISNNFIPTVHKLLDSGADFDMECECGDSLQNAAYFGREEIFDELVARGANPYKETTSFTNALEAAASGGQGRMFEKLLALGMDINVKSARLDNLLQVASRSGENSIVQYLLDHGMDVNLQGGFYGTALIAAVCHGNESTCRILIARGADLLIQNDNHDHRSALHYAVVYSLPDVVRLLLDAGTPIDINSGEYGTVLQLAAQNTSEDVVRLLLDRGADVNIQAGYFGNALQAWSYVGNKEITELLLSNGANPNTYGGFYQTALIAAVHEGHEDIVELLIRYGAEVEMVTTSFGSALDYAILLMRQSSKGEEEGTYGRIVQFLTHYEHDLGWPS
jgi:ankyrin repeat protein